VSESSPKPNSGFPNIAVPKENNKKKAPNECTVRFPNLGVLSCQRLNDDDVDNDNDNDNVVHVQWDEREREGEREYIHHKSRKKGMGIYIGW